MAGMKYKQITSGIPQDGLLAWYEFEDNLNDSSGNGYNLTSAGTFTYEAGIVGKGMNTLSGGAGAYTDAITDNYFRGANNSVSVWFYPEAWGGAALAILKELRSSDSRTTFSISLATSTEGNIELFTETEFFLTSIYTIVDGWAIDTWTNVTLNAIDDKNIDVYLNGSYYGTWTTTNRRGFYGGGGASNRIAISYGTVSSPSSGKLVGTVDQVAFYNRTLTEEYVSQLYSNQLSYWNRIGGRGRLIQ